MGSGSWGAMPRLVLTRTQNGSAVYALAPEEATHAPINASLERPRVSGSGRDPDFEDAGMNIAAAHLRRIVEQLANYKQALAREASRGYPAHAGRTICNECNSGASERAENIYPALTDATDSDEGRIEHEQPGDCAEFEIPAARGGFHSLPVM